MSLFVGGKKGRAFLPVGMNRSIFLVACSMVSNFLSNVSDETDGGDSQKKQLGNPHVELRKYFFICLLNKLNKQKWLVVLSII